MSTVLVLVVVSLGCCTAARYWWRSWRAVARVPAEPCSHQPSYNMAERWPTLIERVRHRIPEGSSVAACGWCNAPLVAIPAEQARVRA